MNKKILYLLSAVVVILPTIAFAAIKSPPEMAAAVEGLMITIGASIVVIGWVVAGILYLLSMGSPEKTGTAKKAMIAAIIGTILVIIATGGYEIIKTFLNPITGTPD